VIPVGDDGLRRGGIGRRRCHQGADARDEYRR
jgi:hypothetical protein